MKINSNRKIIEQTSEILKYQKIKNVIEYSPRYI